MERINLKRIMFKRTSLKRLIWDVISLILDCGRTLFVSEARSAGFGPAKRDGSIRENVDHIFTY
ncbi:hypothetical protein QJS10_CPB18g01068 [Acorus calamus]|uniref:Uncharacterized protein n=1 Tax=Acorus calamus TaxID=4465 RepID=A0AAV9CN69_ACOCL|nr:hypothetical protein QJS10_CPB18g01068 [Acorus calamus]